MADAAKQDVDPPAPRVWKVNDSDASKEVSHLKEETTATQVDTVEQVASKGVQKEPETQNKNDATSTDGKEDEAWFTPFRHISRKMSNGSLKAIVDKFYDEWTQQAFHEIVIKKFNLEEQHNLLLTLKDQMDSLHEAGMEAFGSRLPTDLVAVLWFFRNQVKVRTADFKRGVYLKATKPRLASASPLKCEAVPVEEKSYFSHLKRYCELSYHAYELTKESLESKLSEIDWSAHSPAICERQNPSDDSALRRMVIHKHVAQSKLHQPAHFIVVLEENDGEEWKPLEVILCVRGTASVHDVVSDICQKTVGFCAEDEDGGEVHGGMMAGAVWLAGLYGDMLKEFEDQGVKVSLTGHSLGAGTAALLTMHLLQTKTLKHVRCFAFACPAVACKRLSQQYHDQVTTVIHDDDFVTRSCSYSLLELRNSIDSFTDHFDELEQMLVEMKKDGDKKILSMIPRWLADSAKKAELVAAADAAFEEHVLSKIRKDKEDRLKLLAAREIFAKEDTENGNIWTSGPTKYRQLFPPGKTLHLYRSEDAPKESETASSVYTAVQVPNERFGSIEISPTLATDHLCGEYLKAIDYFLEDGNQDSTIE